MAHHKSAVKRHRQSLTRRTRNRNAKSAARSAVVKARAALQSGDVELARKLTKEAESSLASAASKGVYHWRTASRTISRLSSQAARAGVKK